MQISWLTRDDGLVGLQNSVEEDELSHRQPSYSIQKFSLSPKSAVEATHYPGSCQLLYLQHDCPIGKHQSGFEGSILGNPLQAIDPSGELLHYGLAVVPDVVVPLHCLV